MYKYKIIDNSVDDGRLKEGQATLEQLKRLLPGDIYERLTTPGTISIKERAGHESFEIVKVQ